MGWLSPFAVRSLGAIALAIALWLVNPGTVGLAAPAKQAVILDSRPIFEVSDSGFSARERATDATRILRDLVRDPDAPLQVEIEEVETPDTEATVPVLKVDGNHLISVTAADTPEGRTPREQAAVWQQQLTQALQQARLERSRQYFLRTLPLILGIGLLALAAHWGLLRLWQIWVFPWARRQGETAAEPHQHDTIARALSGSNEEPIPASHPEGPARVVLYGLQGALWLAAATYISERFAQTRQASRLLLDTITNSLTADIVPLGERAYSVYDLLVLVALLIVIFVVARNVRRLLRTRVLNLTGLDRSTQETIAVVANYTVMFVSALVLLQLWGLDISSLTVFAGVLGVGVGLGLQGIAKEFVSGLVLIFERPVQVGDFVEVGDMSGTVEQINLRSTEILTIDRISVILPNSRLLEAEVVNWSHGNPISRLRVPVGVAYGSDLKQVRAALLQAAREHPDVLQMPPPSVLFRGFESSALSLDLLTWIAEPRKQFRVKSDLYFRIDELFRARNIDIPFPQRDLHLHGGTLPVELSPHLTTALDRVATSLTDLLQNSPSNGTTVRPEGDRQPPGKP